MKLDFDINEYLKKLKKNNKEYFYTFINKRNLAMGILFLKPGEQDIQEPHAADEIYYVINGNGYLKINKKDYLVSEGKAFFVAKNVKHYFFGNTKDLTVLYFFAGPDS